MAELGDIAVCQAGIRGVITKVKSSPVAGVMYYGHREDDPTKPWQSNNPKVVEIIDEHRPTETQRTTV